MGDRGRAREALDAATPWILHSGSVEHLCLYHVTRAGVLVHARELQAAESAVREGLRLAEESGMRLEQIELLNLWAEICLDGSEPAAAEELARESLRIASLADCQFQWGAAEAGHLLGHALVRADRRDLARSVLETAWSLRVELADPRAGQTEVLLRLSDR
jgi:hypothetical protein